MKLIQFCVENHFLKCSRVVNFCHCLCGAICTIVSFSCVNDDDDTCVVWFSSFCLKCCWHAPHHGVKRKVIILLKLKKVVEVGGGNYERIHKFWNKFIDVGCNLAEIFRNQRIKATLRALVVVHNVGRKTDDKLLIILHCLPKYLWREPSTTECYQKFQLY